LFQIIKTALTLLVPDQSRLILCKKGFAKENPFKFTIIRTQSQKNSADFLFRGIGHSLIAAILSVEIPAAKIAPSILLLDQKRFLGFLGHFLGLIF